MTRLKSLLRPMRWVLLVLIALATVGGCDTGTFDPFDNDQRYFTVYGFLDERSPVHSVRVIPVSRLAADIKGPSEPQASIDGVVTSTDVRTGRVTIWDHALTQLSDGTYGHVFHGRFQVIAGRTYRLEITRNDGKVTAAETTVPRLPITVPNPDTLFFPYEVTIDTSLVQEVYLPGVPSPWDMYLVYDLSGTNVRIPYGRAGRRTDDGGWAFTVSLEADAPRLREALGRTAEQPLPLLHAITLQARILDADWDPPDGEFDPEVLAQPGVVTNVENGYGLWASIGQYQHTWIQRPRR